MSKTTQLVVVALLGLFIASFMKFPSISLVELHAEAGNINTTYSEVLNYNVQMVKDVLTKLKVPSTHYVWSVLENVTKISNEISQVERSDKEQAKRLFENAMNLIQYALFVTTNEPTIGTQLVSMKDLLAKSRELHALNDTLRNIMAKLLILNGTTTVADSKIKYYIALADNALDKLKSLNQYLEGKQHDSSTFNNTYFLTELNTVKEIIATLDTELTKIQLDRSKERFIIRLNDRLKVLDKNVIELRKDLNSLSKFSNPNLSHLITKRYEDLIKDVNEVNTRLEGLRNLSGIEYVRVASQIKRDVEVLNLKIAEFNTTVKYIPRVLDSIYSRVLEINETSIRVARWLGDNGKLPPTVRERLNQVLKINSQLTYLSDELTKYAIIGAGNLSEVLSRFEVMAKEGKHTGRDFRELIRAYTQISEEVTPLIDRVEGSFNNVLENIGRLNEISKTIRDEKVSQVKKLIRTSIVILNDLKLYRGNLFTMELINNVSLLLNESLDDVNSGNLNDAINTLNKALNILINLRGRLTNTQSFMVKDIIRYVDSAINLIYDSH
ncbi:MAG: hypothetical protein RMH77_02950 [Sulfolobales archaeon]|nr:hypothetical protein [Sulfolobales archaeon]MCX8186054.1 hypothetical protein [Sulfolobales archaeon]MDW7969349.1 hypothetical protein [Sulfolobales archaeon]